MRPRSYENSVFVNCPFDEAYRYLFEGIVFAIFDCGYSGRCSLEADDASQVRIDKIMALIEQCRFGIHDISRTELDSDTKLPRFNMPLELGLFLGAKRYGGAKQRTKICLILDVERYRFQKFISDIAGQDIAVHRGEPVRAITAVRDWLSNATQPARQIPSGSVVISRYAQFRSDLPEACKEVHLRAEELTFRDYVAQVEEWLKLHPIP